MSRAGSIAVLFLSALPGAAAGEEEGARWRAGAYSFSDELGGFRIRGVAGTGTREDPIVVEQEFEAATPVTLVIRATEVVHPYSIAGNATDGFVHMRIEILNNSGQPWLEFEFELQEVLGEASIFGDGLSFDQRRSVSENISSSTFAEYSRDFEPYDRLLYRYGHVDPLETTRFSFLITDFTPKHEFYLVQDPRIPSS